MPFYRVEHAIPLTSSQQEDLATAITHIHSQTFTTPKNFVNVRFIDVSNAIDFIGGKRRNANHIHANVRSGPSRTREDWEHLCNAVERAWYNIAGMKGEKEKLGHDVTLRSLVMIGGITAGQEGGFMFPDAGGDVQWLHDNWEAFNAKANAGSEEFRDMVEDIKERGLLNGTNGV